MRRVAMMLGMAGVIALGVAATPARADSDDWGARSGWRDHGRREQQWRRDESREHHQWRPSHSRYGYYAPARVWFGFR